MTRRQGETVLSYRISLDERQVLLRWGNDPQALATNACCSTVPKRPAMSISPGSTG
ncbi:MAG: hypothetical protein R3F40_10430 [Candidatus Competibacteraceae bacterium]